MSSSGAWEWRMFALLSSGPSVRELCTILQIEYSVPESRTDRYYVCTDHVGVKIRGNSDKLEVKICTKMSQLESQYLTKYKKNEIPNEVAEMVKTAIRSDGIDVAKKRWQSDGRSRSYFNKSIQASNMVCEVTTCKVNEQDWVSICFEGYDMNLIDNLSSTFKKQIKFEGDVHVGSYATWIKAILPISDKPLIL